jgi:hypothetical protein
MGIQDVLGAVIPYENDVIGHGYRPALKAAFTGCPRIEAFRRFSAAFFLPSLSTPFS